MGLYHPELYGVFHSLSKETRIYHLALCKVLPSFLRLTEIIYLFVSTCQKILCSHVKQENWSLLGTFGFDRSEKCEMDFYTSFCFFYWDSGQPYFYISTLAKSSTNQILQKLQEVHQEQKPSWFVSPPFLFFINKKNSIQLFGLFKGQNHPTICQRKYLKESTSQK